MGSFEGGSKKHRSMITDLGWSAVEENAYSFRLPMTPIHQSTSASALGICMYVSNKSGNRIFAGKKCPMPKR